MTKPFPDHARDVLRQFQVSAPQFVAETGIATIWKVVQANGTAAALKIYANGNMQDEAPGFDFLAAQQGAGVARLLARRPGAVLLEWLDGPTLGDLTRAGDDDQASIHLIATAKQLHQAQNTKSASLMPLPRRFRALFDARISANCPERVQLRTATDLAQRLLAAQEAPRPLHGDLHHDNIKDSARGCLAFDAKGVLGDRHYELANAFRNPLGAEATVLTPAAIQHRAVCWAAGYGTTPQRLLHWAAAHAALSLAWTHHGQFDGPLGTDGVYLDHLLSLGADGPCGHGS